MTPPRIPLHDVKSLLKSELGLDPHDIDVLRPGAWSSAFAFTSAMKPFVIRFSEHADDFARDAYAARFATDSLPIPTVTHRGIARGNHYAISERVSGRFIDELAGKEFSATLPSLLKVLDAMRTATVSGSTGYGSWDVNGNGMYASWQECLQMTVQDNPGFRGGSWRAKLESSPTGAEAFDRDVAVLERLLRNMPNIRHVIHSDLINFNAFATDHHISGIIDWGCAMYGDFVYDLAWFQFWSPWYPQWATVNVADSAFHFYESVGADLHSFEERLLCYQIHIGLTHQMYNASIGSWDNLAEVTRLTTTLADKVR